MLFKKKTNIFYSFYYDSGREGASCDLINKKSGESTCSVGLVCMGDSDDTMQCIPLSGKGEDCKKPYQCADGLKCDFRNGRKCDVKSEQKHSSFKSLTTNKLKKIKDKYQLAYDKAFGVVGDPL